MDDMHDDILLLQSEISTNTSFLSLLSRDNSNLGVDLKPPEGYSMEKKTEPDEVPMGQHSGEQVTVVDVVQPDKQKIELEASSTVQQSEQQSEQPASDTTVKGDQRNSQETTMTQQSENETTTPEPVPVSPSFNGITLLSDIQSISHSFTSDLVTKTTSEIEVVTEYRTSKFQKMPTLPLIKISDFEKPEGGEEEG